MRVWAVWAILAFSLTSYAQEPSPAGGNYLDLSEGYYLAKDSPSLDVLLRDEWTIEFWIYLRRIPPPPPDSELHGSPIRAAVSVIIEKVGSYVLYLASYYDKWPDGKKYWLVDLRFLHYIEKENVPYLSLGITYFPDTDPKIAKIPIIDPGRWHYIVFQQKGNKRLIGIDGKWGRESELKGEWGKLDILDSNRPFYLGGRALDELFVEPSWIRVALPRIVPLDAMIDELRISNVARYQGIPPVPEGRFKTDLHTLALWHFDEPPGSLRYEDSSGNGNILFSYRFFPVDLKNKTPLLWGKIKQMP